MRRNHIQRSDVYSEFACLCELADARAQAEEIGPGDGSGEVGEGGADVVDAAVLDAEDVAFAVGGGDELG